MNKASSQIVWVYIYLGLISVVYFFSILVGCPFVIGVVVAAAVGIFSYRFVTKNAAPFECSSRWELALSYLIFLAGLFVIAYKVFYIEKKYGDWDAWYMWNYHGKFLADSKHWKGMFQLQSYYHPDYPLYIPGFLAFFWRMMGNANVLVGYAFSLFTTIAVPVLIFLQLYRKNLLVASIVLFIFATDEFYLQHAIAQYADIPLGTLLICILICKEDVQVRPNNVVSIVALCGCCMWMKNEGLMIALMFMAFNFRMLFFEGQYKKSLPVLLLFGLALLLLKIQAPANDMVNGAHEKIFKNIFSGERYGLIYNSIVYNFDHHFQACKITIILFLVYCIVRRRLPMDALMMLGIGIAYFVVYLLLSDHLEWQLETSLDRIILQLMPAGWYIMARQLSDVPLTLRKRAAK